MAELLEWAEGRPIFNLNEVERATGLKRDNIRVKLSRKAREGKIHRVERGKYSITDDPFVYASHIENPSYISLWSALNFYNLTTQQPTKVEVVCSKNRKDLENVKFYKASEIFGYSKENYRGYEILVAEKEKLLVDALSYGEIPADELIELVEEVNLEKTAEYVQRFGKKAVSKRAGYLIEKVRKETLEELKVKDGNYPLLDLTKPDQGKKDSEWRLKVNSAI